MLKRASSHYHSKKKSTIENIRKRGERNKERKQPIRKLETIRKNNKNKLEIAPCKREEIKNNMSQRLTTTSTEKINEMKPNN